MLDVAELSYIMDEGVTEPINCRLFDGRDAVVKYPNNPCGTSTLINEWIGNSIAREIGVTIPDFGLCYLDSDIIYTNESIDNLDESNTGVCFYSEFMSKAVPLMSKRHVINCETERIILLDHVLNNFDRHIGNLFYDVNTSTLYAIDYSHIFSNIGLRPDYNSRDIDRGMNPEEFLYTDILDKNRPVYEILSYSAGYDDNMLRQESERIKPLITYPYLKELIGTLPHEWLQSVGCDKVNRLIEFVLFRVNNIEKIADMIVKEF